MPRFAIAINTQSRHWYTGNGITPIEASTEEDAKRAFEQVHPPSGGMIELVEIDYEGRAVRTVSQRINRDVKP